MSNFNRYFQPTYTSAPTLTTGPATTPHNGINYRFINVVSGGNGSSGSAFCDTSKLSGPNVGTFMSAFGEDATSLNLNRGIRALAENTDYLDDIINKDIALPTRTANATAPSPVSSVTLPAGTYVGHVGGYPIDMLFSVVDSDDEEIQDTLGGIVTVTSITGATIGTGFSASTVDLNFSQPIPTGVTYRVYYSSRSCIATLPVDALSFIKIRGAQEVSGAVETVLSGVKGGTLAWDASPPITLQAASYSGLNERYRRKTTADGSVEAEHPVTYANNTAGSGSYFVKDGPGIISYVKNTNGAVASNTETTKSHMFGASFGVYQRDVYVPTTINHRLATASGFVFMGQRDMGGQLNTTKTPGVFAFAYTNQIGDPLAATPANNPAVRTQIRSGTTVNLATSVLTLTAPDRFYTNLGNGNETDLAISKDIIRVTVAGVVHSFRVTSFVSDVAAQIENLDGSVPNFSATTGTVVDWQHMVWFISENSPETLADIVSGTPPSYNDGFYYRANAAVQGSSVARNCPAEFYGQGTMPGPSPDSSPLINLGYISPATGLPVGKSRLNGDGSMHMPTIYTEAFPEFKTVTNVSQPVTYDRIITLANHNIAYNTSEFNVQGYGLQSATVEGTNSAGHSFSFPLRVHAYARLVSVTLWFMPALHTNLPANKVRMSVQRISGFSEGTTLATFNSNVVRLKASDGGAWASAIQHAPTLVGDYSEKMQKLVYTCDQNHTAMNIDNLNGTPGGAYCYLVYVWDESYTDAVAGTSFIAVELNYDTIETMTFP